MSPRAVVFAYHDVGDRCLRALISEGWDVPLLITHEADPSENAWFADVGATASEYGIPVLQPAKRCAGGHRAHAESASSRFHFLVLLPLIDRRQRAGLRARAALNMHGSLLREVSRRARR